MLPLIPKGRDPHKYNVLKSAVDQMVSTPIQLEYAVFILVTPWNMFLFNLVTP